VICLLAGWRSVAIFVHYDMFAMYTINNLWRKKAMGSRSRMMSSSIRLSGALGRWEKLAKSDHLSPEFRHQVERNIAEKSKAVLHSRKRSVVAVRSASRRVRPPTRLVGFDSVAAAARMLFGCGSRKPKSVSDFEAFYNTAKRGE
jgi:hypothetical protein